MDTSYRNHTASCRSFQVVFLALVVPLFIAACTPGADGYASSSDSSTSPSTSPGSGSSSTSTADTTPPAINITAPTSGATYATSSANISVSTTATDSVGLSQLSWSNSKGGSGSQSVSGTSASKSFSMALQSGTSVITVTARDTSGNTSQKQLAVTYTPATTSNSANLTWDPVSHPSLSGYRVYYGTSPGTYLQAHGQGISVGTNSSYTLLGLSSGTRYYFSVTAYDSSNNESGYSNEVYKDIP